MASLAAAVRALLAASLPGLFGGADPAVALREAEEMLLLDPAAADGAAGAPAVEDRRDRFTLAAAPAGPYTLTQPPYPGPRRVRLTTDVGDRTPLRDDEVLWDADVPGRFRLAPRSTRDLAPYSGVEVLYGVVAVFTRVRAVRTLTLELTADDEALLGRAEALALAVLALNREALIAAARELHEDGAYAAEVAVKELATPRAERAGGRLRLTMRAELELTLRRALGADEGRPIRRIAGPGADPARPVDPLVDVEA